MSPEPEKPKKAPRKHVTTACVPCRESKIRVCTSPTRLLAGIGVEDISNRLLSSATGQHHIARIASGKEKPASINMETTNASKYTLESLYPHLIRSENASRPATSQTRHPADVTKNRIPDRLISALGSLFELRRSFSLRELTSLFNLFMIRDWNRHLWDRMTRRV
jgi:hypothetical protein